MTIFIVDDTPGQAEILSDFFLEYQNLDIQIYRSGEECLKNLDKNPEMIFLDYNFDMIGPDAMDGLETLKEIHKRKPDMKVVIFSGVDKLQIAINCKENGAFDYIVKGESAFHRAYNAFLNIKRINELEARVRELKKDTTVS